MWWKPLLQILGKMVALVVIEVVAEYLKTKIDPSYIRARERISDPSPLRKEAPPTHNNDGSAL
jgi:hypothetical protein